MTEENDTTGDETIDPADYEETWVDRLMAEGAELSARLDKLNKFTATEAFVALPKEDKHLLMAQQRCMTDYLNILAKRVARIDAEYFANPNAANPAATVDQVDNGPNAPGASMTSDPNA